MVNTDMRVSEPQISRPDLSIQPTFLAQGMGCLGLQGYVRLGAQGHWGRAKGRLSVS